jgi:PAS domain S-box-containing protein
MDIHDKTAAPDLVIPPAAPEPDAAHWGHLLRHLRGAAYICDAEGYVTHFNEAAAAIWGRRPEIGREQWCGSHRIFLLDGTIVAREDCPMAWCIRDRRSYCDVEAVCERPDGTRRLVRVNPSPLFDAAGNFQGALNEIIDITEFKDADHARAQLAAIVRSSDDAIVSKDLNGVIQTWNQGAQRLFGYTAGEAIGKPITMLMPSDRVSEEAGVLARIRKGESVDHYETVRRRKDGALVDVSLTVSPIYAGYGRIIGASKIARDISERKSAERKLAEADRRKDEFIATLAHELRNPLAPLKTCLHLIRMTGYDSQRIARSTLEMMERHVNHLTRLVEDLLDLSRLTHGTIELKKERVSLGDVVSDALEIVTPLVESKGHRLDLTLPQNLTVIGDRTRLVQVVSNLLNNAAKFTPSRGLIRLSVRRQGNQVDICVADNGVGIATDEQEAVFGMFNRLRPPGSGTETGMGIGLSLVKHLVSLHDGTIMVHSDGPGLGAKFTVRLPLAPAVAAAIEPGTTKDVKRIASSRRVLVVDDNVDAAEAMSVLFQTLGHEVRTAFSGSEALVIAREFEPDVVLLDIGLPDINGHDVAARLRHEPRGKELMLVALTGWGQEQDRQRSAAAGFDHHFVKPVDLDALEALMGNSKAVRH